MIRPCPKPTRKYKKTERKKLDEECLRLWSLCVRERDKTCRNCNSDTNLQAHHIFSRRHASLRYSLDNAICLCGVHHSLGSFSAHNDPDFKERLIATGVRTGELFDRLREERNRIQKNTAAWKLECYERLKAYL